MPSQKDVMEIVRQLPLEPIPLETLAVFILSLKEAGVPLEKVLAALHTSINYYGGIKGKFL